MSEDISTFVLASDSRQIKVAEKDLDNMGNAAGRAERQAGSLTSTAAKLSGAFGALSGALAAVGISRFLVEGTTRSIEFSKSLAQISTQLDDSVGGIDSLSGAAKRLSAEFGTLPVDQTKAFYEIISAGISDVDEATDLLVSANKLAIGGNTNLATSVDGLTNIMNSYAGKVESAEAVSDALFVGMKAGKATMEELSSSLGKVTPIASTLNVSFDELVATVSALSKQGISTAESVTGVRAILSSIAKPTKEASDLAENLGLEFNSAGLQAKGFAGFLKEVSDKTGGSVSNLALLFGGVEALIPIMALSGQAGKDFTQIMQGMGQKVGATQDAFDKMASSPGFKIDKLMASISNIAITLGDSLASVLAPAAEKASNALNKLFGITDLSVIDKQKQKLSELQVSLDAMNDRKHLPFFLDTFLFDKKQADLLKQQIEDGVSDLNKFELAASETGGELKKLTGTTEDESKAITGLRKVMDAGAETAKKYADPLKTLRDQQAGFKAQLDAGAITQEVYNRALKTTNDLYNKSGIKTRKDAVNELNKAQQKALSIESEYIKLLEIEKRQRQDLLRPYEDSAKHATQRLSSMQDEIAALQLVGNGEKELQSAVERVTIAKLEEQRASVQDPKIIAQIDAEIAARNKIRDLIPLQNELVGATRSSTNQVSQLWIQTGRNIQTSLANSIFDFFTDGLDGMVRNVKNASGRILSEFGALKLSQAIGLDRMFGGVGGTGTTAGGSLGSIFDIASLGNSAMSFFSNGSKALGSMLGRGASALGAGAFGAGASGAATAGVFGAGGLPFLGGAGTAIGGTGVGAAAAATEFGAMATMGAGMSAIAGPLAALAAGFMGGKMIAGENKIAGINGTTAALIGTALGGPVGAVVGGAILKLFGREAYKFRQQSLQGTVSNEGFDGDITNVERAKGGLLRSNAHRSKTVELTNEMQDAFDTATGAFYNSAHGFAENLGLDVNLVDGFSKEIQIKSEKGKQLTAEAVTAMIAGIGDSIASNLIPTIDTLKRGEETSYQTLSRLNDQFSAINGAAMNLGASMDYARELVKNMSFESRDAFIAMSGGMEALASKTQFFAENFLTDSERLQPTIDMLHKEMTELGFSADITKDQFRELVQSLNITDEVRNSLLDLAPAFLAVSNAAEQAAASVEQVKNLLTAGVMSLGGSAEYATNLIGGLSAETRQAYLDAFGGAEAFAANAATYSENFLTVGENMANTVKFVEDGLTGLGISSDITKEQFGDLIQTLLSSASVTDKLNGALLFNNQAAFLAVDKYKNGLKPQVEDDNSIGMAQSAFDALKNSVESERAKITARYNNELGLLNTNIQDITGSIGKLKSFTNSMRSTVNDLKPMDRAFAKRIAQNSIKSGNFDSQQLQFAIGTLKNQSTDGFANSFEFAREQAKSAGLLTDLGNAAESQLTEQQKQLRALESQKITLEDGFRSQTDRLDSIILQAERQINELLKVNTSIYTLTEAIGLFNNRNMQAGGGVGVIDPLFDSAPTTGNTSISDKQIRDFVGQPGLSEMDIYTAAKKHGISFAQYANATGANLQDLYKWADKNGVPKFEQGTSYVQRTGPAVLHEGERVLTKSQNQDMAKDSSIGVLNATLKGVKEAVVKMQKDIEAIAQGQVAILTEAA